MAQRDNIGLRMGCHEERATAEVAPQDRKRRQSRMPLQPDRSIGEAHGERVREAYRAEEGSGEGRDGGVVDTHFEK